MIKFFLASLESSERPLLAPNYWVLKLIGLILPRNKLGKIAYIFLHELVVFFVFTQFMEIYVIRSDLNLVFTNLKISMVSFICIMKANTFVVWQKKWRQLLDYITETDTYERQNTNAEKIKILTSYTKYCRNFTYCYWGLVFFTYIGQCSTPLIFLASKDFRNEMRNGTQSFPHIISSWMPFEKNYSPGCWVTVIWHFIIGTYGALTVVAYDTTIMAILVFFGGKLKLLRVKCREMLGILGKRISDEEAVKNISKLHNEYLKLMANIKLLNSMLSPVMFLYVVICSISICVSTYQLTSAQTSTHVLATAVLCIFNIAQLFMFCWHTDDVMYKSIILMSGPYESQWWAANVRQRKMTLLLAGMMRPVIIFTAGPFTNLNISTCIAVLKGAYSYYTLFRK